MENRMKKYIILFTLICVSNLFAQLNNIINKTPAQLSEIIDNQTDSDAAYWESHAYLYIQNIVDRLQADFLQANDYATLSAAISAASTDTLSVMVSSRYNITTNTTLSGQTAIIARQGARFNIASGDTLTINVPFYAGDYQVFEGSGVVQELKFVNPTWFGVNRLDTIDDLNAIKKAYNATKDGGIWKLLPGTYSLSDSFLIQKTIKIQGNSQTVGINPSFAGQSPTVEFVNLSQTANTIVIQPSGSERLTGVILQGFSIKGNRDISGATSGNGIVMRSASGTIESCFIDNIYEDRAFGDGLRIDGTVFIIGISNSGFNENGGYGINQASGDAGQFTLTRVTVFGNSPAGLHTTAGGDMFHVFGSTFANNDSIGIHNGGTFMSIYGANIENNNIGLKIEGNGSEYRGLSIKTTENNAIGIEVIGSRNLFQAQFGNFGTSPTHIKNKAGSTNNEFYTSPVPSSLTLINVGTESYMTSLFTRVQANGSPHFSNDIYVTDVLGENNFVSIKDTTQIIETSFKDAILKVDAVKSGQKTLISFDENGTQKASIVNYGSAQGGGNDDVLEIKNTKNAEIRLKGGRTVPDTLTLPKNIFPITPSFGDVIVKQDSLFFWNADSSAWFGIKMIRR